MNVYQLFKLLRLFFLILLLYWVNALPTCKLLTEGFYQISLLGECPSSIHNVESALEMSKQDIYPHGNNFECCSLIYRSVELRVMLKKMNRHLRLHLIVVTCITGIPLNVTFNKKK